MYVHCKYAIQYIASHVDLCIYVYINIANNYVCTCMHVEILCVFTYLILDMENIAQMRQMIHQIIQSNNGHKI